MDARSLQEDLLRISGVEGADLDGSDTSPAGLRIRISEGVDQAVVGGAIRSVLTAHGLGTDTRLPGEHLAADNADEPKASAPEAANSAETAGEVQDSAVAVIAPDESHSIIDLTDGSDVGSDVGAEDSLGLDAQIEPDLPGMDAGETSATPPDGGGAMSHEPAPSQDRENESVAASVVPGSWNDDPTKFAAKEVLPGGSGRIASVAVEEGRDGILVSVVSTDGSSVRHPAASSEGGVEAAVVRATAMLASPDAPDVVVVEIEDRRVSGVDLVMIVLDVDGTMAAGSAVIGAGRAFALARATWAALSL